MKGCERKNSIMMKLYAKTIARAALALFLWTFLFGAMPQYLRAQESKGGESSQIVAEVNQQKISKKELNIELKRQLGGQLSQFEDSELHFLRRQMLEKMIERELLLQEAAKQKLTRSEKDVTDFIDAIKNTLHFVS